MTSVTTDAAPGVSIHVVRHDGNASLVFDHKFREKALVPGALFVDAVFAWM